MGMDVIGKAPANETGEYFRNNVWYWKPLWNYCEVVAPELTKSVSGYTNDGDGLQAKESELLARLLLNEIESGRTVSYEAEYRKEQSELPLVDCELCHATGIRGADSPHGIDQSDKELSLEHQALYGRTHGWCNGCDGAGNKPHFGTQYPFSVENVKEFAEFLQYSGGFSIC
jgi:hypothetical protein